MNRLAAMTGRRVRYKVARPAQLASGGSVTDFNEWIWSVRNHDKWMDAEPEEMRKELKKGLTDIVLKEE